MIPQSVAFNNNTLYPSPPTAYPPRQKSEVFKDWLFEKIHGNKLVYNTCWEDPRCDRAMLSFDANSEIVMITSAGDNALDYLLDAPRRIHCIDVNPRQNALLELKLAAINTLDWPTFFKIFGEGYLPDFASVYVLHLRPRLQEKSQRYWDRHQHYFKPGRRREGLYFHGSSGLFAWLTGRVMAFDGQLLKDINDLLDATSMKEQQIRYRRLEPQLLARLLGGRNRQKISLSMVGVPLAQRQFIEEEAGGLRNYVRDAFRHIFLELPIQENYFYRLYLKGRYTEQCCPGYLKEENFGLLKERTNCLQPHTTTVADFLKKNPGVYSHFVLLDHQDWLAANAPATLTEEWELILANSRPGTRILLRSANSRPETVPGFVRRRTRFRNDLSTVEAKRDRVGTYAGTFLLEVIN